VGDQVPEQDLLAVTAATAQPLGLGLPCAGRRECLTPVAPGLAAVRRGSHAPTAARVGEAGVAAGAAVTRPPSLDRDAGTRRPDACAPAGVGHAVPLPRTSEAALTGGSEASANMPSEAHLLRPLTFGGVR